MKQILWAIVFVALWFALMLGTAHAPSVQHEGDDCYGYCL